MIDRPSTATPRRRPGGRTAAVARASHQAVLDLFVCRSWSEVSLPMVAERAGVHPGTLYRRWGNLENLVVDAVITRFYTDPTVVDTGTLRGDLEVVARRAVDTLTGPYCTVLLSALASMRAAAGPGDPAPVGLEHRRQHVEEIVARAEARGEHPPSGQQILDRLLGPLYARLLFNTPITIEVALGLLEELLGDG